MGKTLILILLLSFSTFAEKFSHSETIEKVLLKTGKNDSTRFYQGSIVQKYFQGMDKVLSKVLAYTDKCNNEYFRKRDFTSREKKCRFHNDNLVESKKITELKNPIPMQSNETDRFILGRHIYNRGTYRHYELVRVFAEKNLLGQREIRVTQRMLAQNEVKEWINPDYETSSAFDQTVSTFTLTEVNKNLTELKFSYDAETSHWILNKEIAVSQVFSSIQKSLVSLTSQMVEPQAKSPREIASN